MERPFLLAAGKGLLPESLPLPGITTLYLFLPMLRR